MSIELVDIPLASNGTLNAPYDPLTLPARMAEYFTWEQSTEDLIWTGPTKISTGKEWLWYRHTRRPQPYGVIRWIDILAYLKERNLCRPEATYVMSHIATWSLYHGRRPHFGMT